MTLTDSLTEFFLAKDHAPATRRFYRQNLETFFTWASAQGVTQVEGLTAPFVRRYLDERKRTPHPTSGQPLSSHSIHAIARALLAWLRWLAAEELLDPKVPARLSLPRREQKVLQVLDAKQIARLFLAADNGPTATRDRAILSVLLDTGIRANELCGLERSDVHLTPDDGYLLIRQGKGRRQREVPLGRKARLAVARQLRNHKHDSVFPSKGGFSLTPSGLDQALYTLYDRAGRQHFQGLKLGAHVFRHTFAVRFLEAGGELYQLSRLMGHSQVTTTEGYLRAVTARQARQRAVSPLDTLGK